MAHLLLIAHAPLASALRQVAEHIFPDCAPMLSVLDVGPGMDPAGVAAAAQSLMAADAGAEWLVLTDAAGATPGNGAARLVGDRVQVVTGVSVPMLWRSLCYAGQLPLAELSRRAAEGAASGILSLPALGSPSHSEA